VNDSILFGINYLDFYTTDVDWWIKGNCNNFGNRSVTSVSLWKGKEKMNKRANRYYMALKRIILNKVCTCGSMYPEDLDTSGHGLKCPIRAAKSAIKKRIKRPKVNVQLKFKF
jgi:hypothetical protein